MGFKIPIFGFVRVPVDKQFTVKRKTSGVIDLVSPPGALIGADRYPDSIFQLRVTISGFTQFGDLKVFGAFNDGTGEVFVDETFVFSENTFMLGGQQFTRILNSDMLDFTDPTEGQIEILSVGSMNEEVFSETIIGTIRPSFQPTSSLVDKQRYPVTGTEEDAFGFLYLEEKELDLELKDILEQDDYGRLEIMHKAKWTDNHFRYRTKKL